LTGNASLAIQPSSWKQRARQ